MLEYLSKWIIDHDDRWSFILFYVGGAILLSIFMSLFWVVLLMLAHFFMEIWRHKVLKQQSVLLHAIWHTKLDFGLILLAFVISVYAEVIVGMLGLGQAARGARVAARIGVLQRSIRSILLTVDEFGLLLKAVGKKKKGKGAKKGTIPQQDSLLQDKPKLSKKTDEVDPWKNPSTGDWVSIAFAVICILLIFSAPLLTEMSFSNIWGIIISEMKP